MNTEKEFNECVKNNRLKKEVIDQEMIAKELFRADKDLNAACQSLEENNFEWATIQAYYACFHAAKSLVLKKGFREKSHFRLATALDHLYVETGELPEKFKGILQSLRTIREAANYSLEQITKDDAKHALSRAVQLTQQAKKHVKTTTP